MTDEAWAVAQAIGRDGNRTRRQCGRAQDAVIRPGEIVPTEWYGWSSRKQAIAHGIADEIDGIRRDERTGTLYTARYWEAYREGRQRNLQIDAAKGPAARAHDQIRSVSPCGWGSSPGPTG
jgi:hypothetical protein